MGIEIKHIDNEAVWEGFIAGSQIPTSFFQSWKWGLFEKSLNKTVHFLGFYQEEELLGIGLAIEVAARRGNFLHFRNGPLLKWDQSFSLNKILDLIEVFARDLYMDFVRVSPLVLVNGQAHLFLKRKGYVPSQLHDVDAEITWMLDLTLSEETILENMRKNTRYAISRAKRDGIQIGVSSDADSIDEFWPIYQDTVRRQNWKAYSKEYIRSEFEVFSAENSANMFIAKLNGKPIAGSIFIYYQDQAYYHHSGSLTEYRKYPAPYLIQWESILEAKRRGLKTYNFFGIARDGNPKHPWAGLTFFKKGFGGYEQRWLHAHDKPLKPKYWATFLFELIERRRRGY